METTQAKWEVIHAPDTAAMEAEVKPVIERAMTLRVKDQAGLEAASADLGVVQKFRKRWEAIFRDGVNGEKKHGPLSLAIATVDSIRAIMAKGDQRPGEAEVKIKAEIARYHAEETARREAAAREEQRLAEEEERKRREAEAAEMKRQAAEDEKRRKAEAEAERKRLEAEGASKREVERLKREQEAAAAKAKADAVAEIAAMKAAPIAVAAPPPAKVAAAGLSIPMVWKATVTDPDAVPRKWLGEVEVSRIERAKTADPSLNVPGIVFKHVPRVSGRGK